MHTWCGHLPKDNIASVAAKVLRGAVSYDWLFVRLDSSPIRLLTHHMEMLLAKAQTAGVIIRLTEEGMWMGTDGVILAAAANIVVPFSAAYVFRARETRDPITVEYDLTSDAEIFEEGIPAALERSMRCTGAVGFLADGCGLNVCTNDKVFYDRVL